MAVEQLTINDEQLLDKLGSARELLLREIRKAIIGQDDVVEQVLLSLFVGGHSIITGVPGPRKDSTGSHHFKRPRPVVQTDSVHS